MLVKVNKLTIRPIQGRYPIYCKHRMQLIPAGNACISV
jgi:hypothetical protein